MSLDPSLLYEKLADRLAALIDRGALRPGQRVPSVRALARRERVSVSTVLHAYLLLESRGLVEARPQSGHYVRQRLSRRPEEPRTTKPPSTSREVSVSELVRRVYSTSHDPKVVQLGAATPSPELLPTERLNRTLAAVARRAGGVGVTYDIPPGCAVLRREVARRAVENGCDLVPDDIITTAGCVEALNLALRAVAKPGDTIAIESPIYYGLLQSIESMGMRVVEVPTHPRDGVELDALEAILTRVPVRACLLVPSFSNPLGSCMPDDHRERLAHMLERHDIDLVEDDIYGDLHHGPVRPRPVKAFDRHGRVLLCSSFSKTLAPGYRVGWIAAPPRHRDRVELLKFTTSGATPTLPQLAVAQYLQDGGYDRHLRRLRRAYAEQVERTLDAVATHFPAGTRATRPTGGFVLWVELPRSIDALDFHARLLEQGISVTPGPVFSPSRRYGNFIRLSCGSPWSERIERALVTVGRLACEMASRIAA